MFNFIRFAGLAGIGCFFLACCKGDKTLTPSPPDASADPIYVNDSWSSEDRARYYHTSTGSQLIPIGIVMALEEPESENPFLNPGLLERNNLIPSPQDPTTNPYGLPVGYTVDKRDIDVPNQGGKGMEFLGLSCAACHTRSIQYKGKELRIDGAPSDQNLKGFSDELGAALKATLNSPEKLARLGKKILGDKYSEEAVNKMLVPVMQAVDTAFESTAEFLPVEEGFGRLDALTREANFIITELLPQDKWKENISIGTGPVRYPYIWDTLRMDWVEYMNAIHQPLARNVSVALGVFTPIWVTGPATDPKSFNSQLRYDNLAWIQEEIRKLKSPKWKDAEAILGPIDQEKADRGNVHFEEKCISCHSTPELMSQNARPNGMWKMQERLYSAEEIGTDPNTVKNFAEHFVDVTPLGLTNEDVQAAKLADDATKVPATKVFQFVTGQIDAKYFLDNPVSPEEKAKIEGGLPNLWQSPVSYRARPLNGIWAVSPYLHNGSVPNLFQLLLPADRRAKKFWTGSLEYDPEKVGFTTDRVERGIEFDTSQPGNSNAGHEYTNDLSDEQRYDLLEYLKSL